MVDPSASGDRAPTVPAKPSADSELQTEEFEKEFGEPLRRILDLSTWQPGLDLEDLMGRLEAEVGASLAQEDRVRDGIRATVFPHIADRSRPGAPPLAGIWDVSLGELEKVHRGMLFPGDVEACHGSAQVFDSLSLTIVQLGVCLVGYRGDQGTWSHRLYRRELTSTTGNPVAEALELLEQRERGSSNPEERQNQLSELGSRGIRAYAERAVLTRLSTAAWRMGHGSPAPYAILTGAGALDLVGAGLEVLRELLLEHRRFVFVPSELREKALLTVGLGLRPLEFAVVSKLRQQIEDMVERGHLRGPRLDDARDFVRGAGNEVAVGVYRVSAHSSPCLFFAPAEPELCAQAAVIAMADSVLQEHRGFPLLIDMADQFCQSTFGRETFQGTIQAAYAAHGRPFGFLTQRDARP